MLVTEEDVRDKINMLATFFALGFFSILYSISHQFYLSVTNILAQSPSLKICQQHISLPISVTNIDVTAIFIKIAITKCIMIHNL